MVLLQSGRVVLIANLERLAQDRARLRGHLAGDVVGEGHRARVVDAADALPVVRRETPVIGLLHHAGDRREVIVHELLHLKISNHGKVFKALLKAYLAETG